MAWEMCERSGFDATGIAKRVKLFELDGEQNRRLGRVLQQQVIVPSAQLIVEDFVRSLRRIEQFAAFVDDDASQWRLPGLLHRYLYGFGTNVASSAYFEQRLRIGDMHQRIGIPQPVYQSSYRKLEYELIRNIPPATRSDQASYEALINYILKIIALDISLAGESYCKSQTCRLEDKLQDERGQTERLRELAMTDSLTNLHNHAFSRHLLVEELATSQETDRPLCLIMADLDRFKTINDEHGHLVGDHVLRIAAARMVAAARMDDEICRYGGEEFLFVLANTDLESAAEVAERVRRRVDADEIQHRGASIHASVSLGIAQARSGDTVDDLIGRADAALYAAKQGGRNCVMLENAEL